MLNQDYKDMLSALVKNNVKFLLVGAYALAFYGFPRATADIDIFVKADSDNADNLVKALLEFGAPLDHVSKKDFAEPGLILQIGVAPRRIDLVTSIDGVSFEEGFSSKETVIIEDIIVPVISKENLIKNKQSTGRDKDKLDVEMLKSSI